LLVLDRARVSLGRRCQGNFKPTIVPATCRLNLQADVFEISFDRPRRGEENPVNEAFTGAGCRVGYRRAGKDPAKTMREQSGATPWRVDESRLFRLRMFLSANRPPPRIKSGAGFRRNMRYRFAPLIWVFCSSVSDA
jgi:hypothetical protein